MIPFVALGWPWLRANWKTVGLIAIGVVLLIGAVKVRQWYNAAAQLAESQKVAEEERKKLEAEVKAQQDAVAERNRQLTEEQARSSAFASQASQFASAAARLSQQLDSLSRQRAALRSEIEALPTEGLEPRIKRDLGLRRPEDAERPGFLPEELKAIAHCVSEYPLCEQARGTQGEKLEALSQQVAALSGEVGSLKQQVRLTQEKYEITQATLDLAVKHYATLYNIVGPKKRSPKCLWLWQCTKRQMPVPSPEELKKTAP